MCVGRGVGRGRYRAGGVRWEEWEARKYEKAMYKMVCTERNN